MGSKKLTCPTCHGKKTYGAKECRACDCIRRGKYLHTPTDEHPRVAMWVWVAGQLWKV